MRLSTHSKLQTQIKFFWISALLSIIVFLGLAVTQVNGLIHDSSQFSGLKRQIASLSEENDGLEANLSMANSMANFDGYINNSQGDFEKVDVASVRYVTLAGGQMAKK